MNVYVLEAYNGDWEIQGVFKDKTIAITTAIEIIKSKENEYIRYVVTSHALL